LRESRPQPGGRRGWRAPLISGAALLALTPPGVARADATVLGEVLVVGQSPQAGSGVDRDRLPIQTVLLGAQDLARGGAPDALRALEEQVGAISLESASGAPSQPSLFYHGFEASPLQGTAQGLAVYVGGVRFNQAFGDTVNWDLIPALAISRITLEGSNPVFGLNALGGSLSVGLKTGFDDAGGEADLSGGSFGRAQADLQYARRFGDAAVYVAASIQHQDGWRAEQGADIQNLYADIGWRGARGEAHVSLSLADSDIDGPGTSPVELLAADRRAQFTGPNNIANRYAQLRFAGEMALGRGASLQTLAYVGGFRQRVTNGNAPNDTPCADGSGLLCSAEGPSTTLGGASIPAFRGDSPLAYAELDRQTTDTFSYGASAQLVAAGRLFGRLNHAVAGASVDAAHTDFAAQAAIGGISPLSRDFAGPGVIIDEPGANTPVRVAVGDAYAALFGSETLEVSERLSLTLSGRFNAASIDLRDKAGGPLGGRHHYDRFNPALGASYRATTWLTLYGGYAEANRTPTPAELSCASPADACSLANFFVGDPDLKQVISRTYEAGVRGAFSPWSAAAASYSLGFYRTDLDDDIVFVNAPVLGRAYFANIGRTRRQGVDVDLRLRTDRWSAYLDYAHTEATHRSGFVESGGANPGAGADGLLTIRPGDRLPGVPANQVKLGLDVDATSRLILGATLVARDGAYLSGDEANVEPKLPGYVALNLDVSYRLRRDLELFARAENVTDAKYATFGTFSATSAVFLAPAPHATNPRSLSPAAPVGVFGGFRLNF
jgi:outer membrane receptor protein involved in Fe transport